MSSNFMLAGFDVVQGRIVQAIQFLASADSLRIIRVVVPVDDGVGETFLR